MTEKFDPKIYGVSPSSARHRLEFMGFEEDTWEHIMSEGFDGSGLGSHEVRALITIARGTEPQLLGVVYREMRKKDNLPEER